MSILKESKKTDKAMKDVYCDLMMEMAEKDEKIVLLDSDLMSSLSVMPFAKKFPENKPCRPVFVGRRLFALNSCTLSNTFSSTIAGCVLKKIR